MLPAYCLVLNCDVLCMESLSLYSSPSKEHIIFSIWFMFRFTVASLTHFGDENVKNVQYDKMIRCLSHYSVQLKLKD